MSLEAGCNHLQSACGKSYLKGPRNRLGTRIICDVGIVLSWEKVPLSLSHLGGYDVDEKEELFHWKAWGPSSLLKKSTGVLAGRQLESTDLQVQTISLMSPQNDPFES